VNPVEQRIVFTLEPLVRPCPRLDRRLDELQALFE